MSANTVNSGAPSEPEAFEKHRIVVFGVDDDPTELVDVLIASHEFDRMTARQLVRSLPGIIPRDLSRTVAASIADDIRALGLHATAVAAAEVPDLSHATHTHHMRLTDATLETADEQPAGSSWLWADVVVISVGIVPSHGPAHHHPAPSLAQGSSHKLWNEGATIPARNHPEAFVVLAADHSALTFASDEMNYEYLGSRMKEASSSNFRQLMKDLVAHAPKAWVTASTRAFLDRSPPRHYEFRSRDEFRRYTEFQTLLSDLP